MILFDAFEKQQKYLEAVFSGRYKYLMYGGAIRGGKSFVGLAAIILLAKKYPGSRWAIVRKDLPTLRRNTIPSFMKLKPDGFCGPMNQSTWTVTCSNGSEIIFFPEGLKQDPDLERWKGLEVNGFLLEEASELSQKGWNKAIERAGAWIVPVKKAGQIVEQPPPLILLTVNPSAGWVRQIFYEPWKQGRLVPPFYFMQAYAKDNPFLTQAYLDSLEELPAHEYKRFVLGDWDAVSGMAFEELDRSIHFLSDEENKKFEIKSWHQEWSSFDWGFQHPFSACHGVKDDTGSIVVVDSVHGHKLLDAEIAQRMIRGISKRALGECYADGYSFQKRKAHDGELPSVDDVFRGTFDIHLFRAYQDRIGGAQALRRGLSVRSPNPVTGKPYLRFRPTEGNEILWQCLLTRVFDELHHEDVLKTDADPLYGKGGDDPYDALRYLAATKIPAPSEPLRGVTREYWEERGMDPNREFAPPEPGFAPQSEYQTLDRSGYIDVDELSRIATPDEEWEGWG